MRTILHIVKKEFLQFKRDPKMFAIILVAPVVQLILLGYAATLDVDVVHTIIYDMDKTTESRALIDRFSSNGFFVIDEYVASYDEVTDRLDGGDIMMALVIPDNLQEKTAKMEKVSVQAIYNGSDANAVGIASSYAATIVGGYSRSLLLETIERRGMQQPKIGTITPDVRVWYNPEMESRFFMVPGIVGLLLSIITLLLTSLAVVKEKEVGTMEQLIVTPIKPLQLMIGKLVPFVLLSYVTVALVLVAMYVVFGIAVRGSLPFLLVSAFCYILSTLGLGLFVSTISKTQQQAMMIAMFAVMMPLVFFSGFAFPVENMPEVIQWFSYIIPLKYFITIIRGVILKGTGFADQWQEMLVLLGMGVSILYLSSLRFSKKLD